MPQLNQMQLAILIFLNFVFCFPVKKNTNNKIQMNNQILYEQEKNLILKSFRDITKGDAQINYGNYTIIIK